MIVTKNRRVHGDIIIKRRAKVEKKKYPEYHDELEKDFHGICGYCGKNEKLFKEHFQIDHFAPQKFKELKDKYENLVYSCPKCNKHKSNKWPTDDATISVVNEKGFVDPASEEYDHHLGRDNDGNIYPITKLGEYMYKTLKFDIRPMRIIYKIQLLAELRGKLEQDNSSTSLIKYKEANKLLNEIIDD